jgi:predicted GIY-YIG superfamily endonuclease
MSMIFYEQQTFSFKDIDIEPTITRQKALQKGIIPDEYKGDLTVYLLHFPPMGGNKHKILHYIGSCKDLKRRLRQHRKGHKGNSSAITAALKAKRLKFHVGHIWEGVNHDFEYYIKSWRMHKAFCEICQDVPFF